MNEWLVAVDVVLSLQSLCNFSVHKNTCIMVIIVNMGVATAIPNHTFTTPLRKCISHVTCNVVVNVQDFLWEGCAVNVSAMSHGVL